jgi:hypothetical protein
MTGQLLPLFFKPEYPGSISSRWNICKRTKKLPGFSCRTTGKKIDDAYM